MNKFVGMFGGIACGVLLLGCTKEPVQNPGATALPSLREIRLGENAQVGPQYADQPVVATLGLRPPMRDSKLEGRLIELKTGQVAASANIDLSDSSALEQKLVFRRAAPWMPGRYLIEMTLDGRMIAQQDVDVIVRPATALPGALAAP